MSFSVTEKDYIYQSLVSANPIRPDGRKVEQLRGLEASINFLPTSNGSSRVRLNDGSEVITSVKSKAVKFTKLEDLIELDLVIDNLRDDLVMINEWQGILKKMVLSNLTNKFKTLKLTSKYYFKLYIDVLFLSNTTNARAKSSSTLLQNPISLISFGIYLALKSTRLPLLTSNTNDKEIEELPTFNDDWSSSILLYPTEEDEEMIDNDTTKISPPLLFVLSVVEDNVFVDPSLEEQEISDSGLIISWCSGRLTSPIELINLNQSGSTKYLKGSSQSSIIKGTKLIEKIAGVISNSLDSIVKDANNSEFSDSIF